MSEHENKQNPEPPESAPKPLGFGKDEARQAAQAIAIAERSGKEIAATFRSLGPRQRQSVVTVFRRQLLPPGKPGRKRSKVVTAAFADWMTGMRGPSLYLKHIPGFDRMGYWKRKVKTRALMDAIRTRERRSELMKSVQQTE